MPSKIFVGDEPLEQYALIEASQKKWPKNVNDLKDDEYESLALKYNANEDALIKKKERNVMEEEPKIKTLLALESKDGKDSESCGSCN